MFLLKMLKQSNVSLIQFETHARAINKRFRCLHMAKQHSPQVLTKTSLMLGLGETEDEIKQAMDDMREHHVDI